MCHLPRVKGNHMKLITRILLPLAAVALLSGSAFAKIDSKLLLGKWKGQIEAKMGDNVHKIDIELTFEKAGTFKVNAEGKEESGRYKIDGNVIVLIDPDKQEEVKLTGIKLSKSKLSGKFEPPADKLPAGFELRLSLTKQ